MATTIDKSTLTEIKADILASLKSIEEKYGISIGFNGGTFFPDNAVLKMTIATVGNQGELNTREKTRFLALCGIYDLKPEHFGATIKVGGAEYTIAGMKPGARVREFLVKKTEDGRTYRVNIEFVKAGLGLPR